LTVIFHTNNSFLTVSLIDIEFANINIGIVITSKNAMFYNLSRKFDHEILVAGIPKVTNKG